MAQQATPERTARLGRALGSEPATVNGVALLLPNGEESSARRPSPLSAVSVRGLGRRLARAGREQQLATHVVHYRYRGWNGDEAHLAHDAVVLVVIAAAVHVALVFIEPDERCLRIGE